MCKAVTLVAESHIKVAFGERLICKEFPEKGRFNQAQEEQMGQCCGEEASDPGVEEIVLQS